MTAIPAKDDVEDFNRTIRSMEVLAFKPLEQVRAKSRLTQESMFRVLSAVLHLGNVSFAVAVRDNMETAVVHAKQNVAVAAGLMVASIRLLISRASISTSLLKISAIRAKYVALG